MKWFVGLGNPGTTYQDTRHNIGFMAVDRFAERWGISFKQSKCKALIGEGQADGVKVALVKPLTYMNVSGEAVRSFMDYYKAELANMTVIYDDLDMVYGQIRLRYQGSAGGHNGIKSIIQHTGTQQFNRIRIGVSRPLPGNNIADYVLSVFSKEERKGLPAILETTVESMSFSLTHSFEHTMAFYNKQG